MIKYRSLQDKDIKDIQQIALKCWLDTYRDIYKEKTIRKTVANYYSTEKLMNNLSDIKKNTEWFCVVLDSDNIVGYSHIGKKDKDWEIFRIYILPKYQRKGIGSQLIKKGEKFLVSKKAKKYIVHPHIKNKLAIQFYKKVGFRRMSAKDRGSTSPCFLKTI